METQIPKHIEISPAILYWGTPVNLITTLNPDGTPNIGPMSSVFWLGHHCMLGLARESQTTINILRTGQCVLNLASDNMQSQVNAIAKTTGSESIPKSKLSKGYIHLKDKFGRANLTPMTSKIVDPPGIMECPVSMEAQLIGTHEMFNGQSFKGGALAIEVRIVRISVHEDLKMKGHRNRIDPDKWRPMIMMFCELYGLRSGKIDHSRLAEIDEEQYRAFTGTTVVDNVTEFAGSQQTSSNEYPKGRKMANGIQNGPVSISGDLNGRLRGGR